jgi:hypothetical protein
MMGCFNFTLRLSPTRMGKNIFALPELLCIGEIVSNKRMQMGMHFASEERGEPKLHSLSPPMHFLAAVGPTSAAAV